MSFYSFLPKGYPGYINISDRHEFQNPPTRCSFKYNIIQRATGFKPQRKAIRRGIRKDQICLRLDWIWRVHVMGGSGSEQSCTRIKMFWFRYDKSIILSTALKTPGLQGAHIVNLPQAILNVSVQSVSAEGSRRGLSLGVFTLTKAHRQAHKSQTALKYLLRLALCLCQQPQHHGLLLPVAKEMNLHCIRVHWNQFYSSEINMWCSLRFHYADINTLHHHLGNQAMTRANVHISTEEFKCHNVQTTTSHCLGDFSLETKRQIHVPDLTRHPISAFSQWSFYTQWRFGGKGVSVPQKWVPMLLQRALLCSEGEPPVLAGRLWLQHSCLLSEMQILQILQIYSCAIWWGNSNSARHTRHLPVFMHFNFPSSLYLHTSGFNDQL